MKSYFHQKSIFFGLCLLTILLAGCRQTDEVDTKVEIPIPPKFVQSNLTGSVFDAYGKAVLGAKVSVGKNSTETDEYGHFQFLNVWVSDPQDHLIVSKDGFFMEQVSVHAFAGDYSYQQIGLVDKIFSSSFSSDSPATFDYA
ncbi:MAG: carboxypeptidase regulatory-like domain-containing protein [Saprospiraceae bacterium]|nr:carboxypeptidase regulatory-like domain-containing protein [Saprospiraceae bacterium]